MEAVSLAACGQKKTGENSVCIYLLRISAIFAIIVMNTAKYDIAGCDVPSFNWQVLNLFGSLARWAVPVFVMIAGAVFLDPEKEMTVKTIFKTHLFKMLCIYVFWSFIYAVIQNMMKNGIANTGFLKNVMMETVKGPVHFWYIPMLSGLYLITPFLRVLVKNSSKLLLQYFLALCFIFGCLFYLLQVLAPFSAICEAAGKLKVNFVAGYTGYFVLGYYLCRYPLQKNMRRLLYAAGAAGLGITVIGTYLLSLKKGGLDETLYSNLSPNYAVIGAAVFVFYEENVKKSNFLNKNIKLIRTVSLCSFGVYIIHYFNYMIFSRAGFGITAINPLLSVPLVSLGIYLLCLSVSFLLSKVRFFNKYLV